MYLSDSEILFLAQRSQKIKFTKEGANVKDWRTTVLHNENHKSWEGNEKTESWLITQSKIQVTEH